MSNYAFVKVKAYFTDADILSLLGLDTMTKLKMIIYLDNDTASSKLKDWKFNYHESLAIRI